jgi:phenylalanyl-tRNA synthetase alpha subunit
MEYDKEKLQEKLAEMTPEERLKHLKHIETEAKKKLQETEAMLKISQELKEKHKGEMLQQAIQEGEQLLQDRLHRKRQEARQEEISALLEEEEKDLEGQVASVRLPVTHPVVGLYSQLRGIQYSYVPEGAESDARITVLPEIREELIEVLSQYKEMPEAMKEIADAAYRLTKDLLGERVAEAKKYFFP